MGGGGVGGGREGGGEGLGGEGPAEARGGAWAVWWGGGEVL